jgi:hypothetical protein
LFRQVLQKKNVIVLSVLNLVSDFVKCNRPIDGDTYIVRGNGNRVLDAGQLDPNNGEQVGGDQEELPEFHRRIREVDEGVEDGGDRGELAGGEHGAQGRIATGPGSILSPGNSPPPRVAPALTGPEAIQWKIQQRK